MIRISQRCLLTLVLVAVFTLLCSRSYAAQFAGPRSADHILLIGRIVIKWDGFRGVNKTQTDGFSVHVSWTDKKSGKGRLFTLKPDSEGYFCKENVPRKGSYGVKEIRGKGWKFPGPPFHLMPEKQKHQVLFLGPIKFTVNAEGKIKSRFSTTPLEFKPFLSKYDLKGWAPIVKTDIDERLEKVAQDKERRERQKRAKPFYKKGSDLMKEEKYKEAETQFLKALKEDPSYSSASCSLIRCYQYMGTPEKAIKVIEDGIKHYDGFFSHCGHDAQNVLWEIGRQDLSLKFAIALIERAKRRNFYDNWARKILAAEYEKRGMEDKILPMYKEGIQNAPNDPWSYWYCGSAYHDRGKYKEAIKIYEKGLSLSKQHSQNYRRLQEKIEKSKNKLDKNSKTNTR